MLRTPHAPLMLLDLFSPVSMSEDAFMAQTVKPSSENVISKALDSPSANLMVGGCRQRRGLELPRYGVERDVCSHP